VILELLDRYLTKESRHVPIHRPQARMIGPWESPHGDEMDEPPGPQYQGLYGPLDAMLRLDPPNDTQLKLKLPPMWVERYGSIVVTRHTYVDASGEEPAEALTERAYPTDAAAVRGVAEQVTVFRSRGYRVVVE
jgi:hypothetical protein